MGRASNIGAIKDWILSLGDKIELTLSLNNPITLLPDQAIEMLTLGFANWGKDLSNRQKNGAYKLMTRMFKPMFLDDESLDERFALLTTQRSFYQGRIPTLTLGTIVQLKTDSSYLLCIQPRCDCVRVEANTAFLFLPMKVDQGNGEKFDMILQVIGRYVKLVLQKKTHDLRLVKFTPGQDDKETIVGKLANSEYYFTDVTGATYTWVGELRSEHAQRIANEFAANLSRVGLDESEWLRLWATRG